MTEPTADESAASPGGFLAEPRTEWLAVGGLMLLALVIRVVYVLEMRASPTFAAVDLDPLYNLQWAQAFAAGEDFHPGPFFRAPLYLWFLGGLVRLLGDDPLTLRLAQCVLGALTTGLVYLVGKRAFDRATGFLAAVAAASYWVLVYYDGELLIPTLFVPLTLLTLWLALGYSQRPSLRSALLTGLALGVAALARPNILLFAPLVALWMVARAAPAGAPGAEGLKRYLCKAALLPGALFSASLLVPILPVSAYNTFVADDFALISTQGGVNLWIGNNPDSDGRTAVVPGTRAGWWTGYHDAIAQASAAEGRDLEPSEVSRHYSARAWDFILGSPAESLGLMLRKAKMLWSHDEIGNNQPVRFFAYQFSTLARLLPLGFALLVSLGALGWLLSLRRGNELFPLVGFVPVYAATIVLFFVCSRFRVPLLAPLCIFAAHAALWTFARVRAGELGKAGVALFAVATGMLASYSHPGGTEVGDGAGYWKLGVAYGINGDAAQAELNLRKALEVSPGNTYAMVALAKVLDASGRSTEALDLLRQVHPTVSGGVDALQKLFEILAREERWTELDEAARLASSILPQLPESWMYRARARYSLGDPEGALAQFEEARRCDPNGFESHFSAGLLALELRRRRPAVEALQQAVVNRSRAGNGAKVDRAFETLIQLLKPEQALPLARQYAEERPGERSRQLLAGVERAASGN